MNLNFGINTFQLTLFLTAFDLKDKLLLAQQLRTLKSIDLNGEPTLLPLPVSAPIEIPRIILKSEDNSYGMNISLNRVDLIFKNKDKTEEGIPSIKITNIKETTIKSIQEIYDIFEKKYSANINRGAVIARHIIKLKTDSKSFLESKLLQPLKTKPFEIKIALLYKEKLGHNDFEINKWHRVDSLRNKDDNKDDTAIAFTHDINTIPETNYNFSNGKLSKFYNLTTDLIEKEINQFTHYSK